MKNRKNSLVISEGRSSLCGECTFSAGIERVMTQWTLRVGRMNKTSQAVHKEVNYKRLSSKTVTHKQCYD